MEINSKRNIHERIYNLVFRVLRLIRQIPKTPENLILISQLARSITSTGANDQEADGAESKSDFIHKYGVVKKEAKESGYWLKLLGDLNPDSKYQTSILASEVEEIVKIVSTIIHNTKQNLKKT